MTSFVTNLAPEEESALQLEGRMTQCFLEYWKTLRCDLDFPLITDLDLGHVREYSRFSFCLQLDPDEPVLRFVGRELALDSGGDFTNRKLSELPKHSLLTRVADHLSKAIAQGGPFVLSDGYYNPECGQVLYRAIMLPFSISGRRIDYIIGAVNRSHGHVIVLGSGKGGTGKSTTAMHLIASLLYRGDRVGSIDLDNFQCTLSRYIENRELINRQQNLNLPVPKHLSIEGSGIDAKSLDAQISRLVHSCDYVVIDTPGSDTDLSRIAHALADTLITPINDSFVDLDALAILNGKTQEFLRLGRYAEIVDEARRLRAGRKDKPMNWIVLRNRLSNLDARNKRRMADSLEKISTELDFRNGLGFSDRVIYRELFPLGLTLLDLHKEAAGVSLSMSHLAARQELRALMEIFKRPRNNVPLRALRSLGQV
jgi:chromosome partitioning protein